MSETLLTIAGSTGIVRCPGWLEIDMYYLLFYDVVSDYLKRRAAYRTAHLALAVAAQERSELLLGGALADPADGAVLLFQGDSPAVVEDFVHRDPYVKNGLVTDWRIREWILVAGTGVGPPEPPALGGGQGVEGP